MTSMEKKLTENRLTEVKAALSAKYRTVDLGGEKFFVATDGAFFRVGVFPGANGTPKGAKKHVCPGACRADMLASDGR